LIKEDVRLSIYDPAGMEEAKKDITDFDKIHFSNSAKECLSGAKICFIATPWQEFRILSKQDFLHTMAKKPVIFDGWNLYSFENDIDIKYIRIGKEN
jgi:UDP-glucose 6-dehydrogenase